MTVAIAQDLSRVLGKGIETASNPTHLKAIHNTPETVRRLHGRECQNLGLHIRWDLFSHDLASDDRAELKGDECRLAELWLTSEQCRRLSSLAYPDTEKFRILERSASGLLGELLKVILGRRIMIGNVAYRNGDLTSIQVKLLLISSLIRECLDPAAACMAFVIQRLDI